MGRWFSRKQQSTKRRDAGSVEVIRQRRQAHLKRLQKRTPAESDDFSESAGHTGKLRPFLWLLFFGTAAYASIWSQYVSVESVTVAGSASSEVSERVRQSTQEYLSEKIYGVIPRKSFLFIRPGVIESRLFSEFPEIRSVRIEKAFPKTLHLQVDTRDRFLVTCSGGPCFVVDESGKIRGDDAAIDPSFPRIRIVDASGAPFSFSDPVFSETFIGYVLGMQESVRDRAGIDVTDTYTTPSRLSGVVEVPTAEGWSMLLNSEIPLEHSLDLLKLFLEKQVSKADRARLQYVDLRLENRIYYRFVDSDQVEGGSGESPVAQDAEKQKPDEKSGSRERKKN